ncbi:type II toxin-antitoxin system Phd/YefM family antitoxin [Roseospira goensis]|uniref:PHD/YefM family antitoxin component YafN of YafNO toxin-antitoxin module n=1 Tax=Roseospira goensis TaxID=391922 RepID=A0A7W6WJG2_9PROT|nr:type II toxin-antitoxin system Phd/YefM family antitoxin [Roseospira goensis]MBB4284462.1 PHD/YefM family antitoxin component YafN of YafNO toxin-antitoxin module [Roseospira goensis]
MRPDLATETLDVLTTDPATFVERLKESGRPALLTHQGEPALVAMAPEAWQALRVRLEEAETMAALREGLAQAAAGEVMPADTVFRTLTAIR